MSIRLQILKAIDLANKPLLVNEIYNGCPDVETASQIAAGTYNAASQGLLAPVKGEGGTRYELTAKGRELLTAETGVAATTPREPKPARKLVPFKRRKAKPAKRAKKAKKAKRKYTRRTVAPASRPLVKREVSRALLRAPAARWAVTHDGAFVDLTDPRCEISKERARQLVDFVRKLDAAGIAV